MSKFQDCKEFPFVAIIDDMNNKEKYYFISAEELKEHTIKRKRFNDHMAISISHFCTPILSYDDLLTELIKEIKK